MMTAETTAMANRIVGLSFDGGQIRAVEVASRRRGEYVIEHSGSAVVPEGALEDGQIVQPEPLADSLRELWDEAGFTSRKVQMAIDGRSAVLRRTTLPDRDDAAIRVAAKFDIDDLLTYPVEQAVFDVAVLDHFDREGTAWVNALVVAVEESVLDSYRSLLEAAGLELVDAQFSGDALGSSILMDDNHTDGDADEDEDAQERDNTEDKSESHSVVVDIEDTVTSIFVRDEGGTLFARSISAGVGATALSMADELETELSLLTGESGAASVGASASAPGVSIVVDGVQRTLAYFRAEIDDRPLASVMLTGSRSRAAGLRAELEAATGLHVVAARSSIAWPTDGPDFAGFELSLGAALVGRKRYQAARHLHLRTDASRNAELHKKQLALCVILTLLVAVVLAADGLSRRSDADDLERSAAVAERSVDAMFVQLDDLEDVRDSQSQLLRGERQVEDLQDQGLRYVDVLQETAERMPIDSQLVSVQLRRSGVDGLPTGYVGDSAAGLVTYSIVADDLDTVGTWLDAVNDGRFVNGLWLDQTLHGPLDDSERVGSFFVVEGVITDAARALRQGDQ